jgi:hypothetical protein
METAEGQKNRQKQSEGNCELQKPGDTVTDHGKNNTGVHVTRQCSGQIFYKPTTYQYQQEHQTNGKSGGEYFSA